MRTVFLVPRRADNGPRDKSWEYCRERWERYFPDVPIVEGHHDSGPFSRAKAINGAAKLADADGRWDFGIVIDADVILKVSQVRKAMETAQATGKVTWAHRRWRGITEAWTQRIVADGHECGAEIDHDDVDVWVEKTTPISWSCCFVVPRSVFDDLGGFDERFIGWGFEDLAWQAAVVGLYGHERIEGDVYHLFHPRSDERIILGNPGSTASREYVVNARLGRRYMVALRRDHGLHDRPGLPASAEERERDIANLVRDDAKLAEQTKHLHLPDWSEWWPTLEELRDGAKTAGRTVSLIVHTDGRREYIAKTIPSLLKHVHGSIVRKVIYDDSGDPEYKAWLMQQFGPAGFYVVGPQERLGFTGSMRAMWAYLAKRHSDVHYIFASEDDFLFKSRVDLDSMIDVLTEHPGLAQVALLREPAYPREFEQGGILGWPPESFEKVQANGHSFLRHRNFWTNNPSLFRQSLTSREWPVTDSSERVFGDILNRDPANRFGLWGEGKAQIKHIGEVRAGSGY